MRGKLRARPGPSTALGDAGGGTCESGKLGRRQGGGGREAEREFHGV